MAGLVGLVVLLGAVGLVATGDPFSTVFYWPHAVVGGLIVAKRPRSSIGWAVLLVGIGFVATTGPGDLDLDALEAGTASWRDFLWLWVGTSNTTFIGYVLLATMFPTGRFDAGPWSGPSRLVVAATIALAILTLLTPIIRVDMLEGDVLRPIVVANRFGLPFPEPFAVGVALGTFLVPLFSVLVVGVGALVWRYRNGDRTTRLQLRGFIAAMLAVVLGLLFGIGVSFVVGMEAGNLAWLPAGIAYPLLPLSIAVGVLRYRLFDIDRIISRTLAYAVLTGTLVTIFGGLVVVLQAVLLRVTRGDTLPVAISTLVVFALFQPLRRRIQALVDRRFNRSRIDADRTVAAFGGRLGQQLDLVAVTEDLRFTATHAVQPARVAIWLTTSGVRR